MAARCRARAKRRKPPGVGRKTANVVLNVAFGEPTMAVDTHIFRLGNCTAWRPARRPRREMGLMKRIPPAYRWTHTLAHPARALCVWHASRCVSSARCRPL